MCAFFYFISLCCVLGRCVTVEETRRYRATLICCVCDSLFFCWNLFLPLPSFSTPISNYMLQWRLALCYTAPPTICFVSMLQPTSSRHIVQQQQQQLHNPILSRAIHLNLDSWLYRLQLDYVLLVAVHMHDRQWVHKSALIEIELRFVCLSVAMLQ